MHVTQTSRFYKLLLFILKINVIREQHEDLIKQIKNLCHIHF